jgi:6-pyruvoyltetrahydropterin/6-carboxytetrahydropterin synthase
MKHYSTKTYGHEVGLSCAFRQWRAKHSHCQYLHGYALSVRLVFGAEKLDSRNWVMDFGALGEVKDFLKRTFDHHTVVAADDPELNTFLDLSQRKLIQLTVLPSVGCEAFAQHINNWVAHWLEYTPDGDRVKLVSVEVREHGANSAVYMERTNVD